MPWAGSPGKGVVWAGVSLHGGRVQAPPEPRPLLAASTGRDGPPSPTPTLPSIPPTARPTASRPAPPRRTTRRRPTRPRPSARGQARRRARPRLWRATGRRTRVGGGGRHGVCLGVWGASGVQSQRHKPGGLTCTQAAQPLCPPSHLLPPARRQAPRQAARPGPAGSRPLRRRRRRHLQQHRHRQVGQRGARRDLTRVWPGLPRRIQSPRPAAAACPSCCWSTHQQNTPPPPHTPSPPPQGRALWPHAREQGGGRLQAAAPGGRAGTGFGWQGELWLCCAVR
jgi:hypothetical protein